MDFLDIRRKAKERADARARRGAAAGEAPPAREKPRTGRRRRGREEAPAEDPVVTEADVVEGALMAEMQGRSELPPAASDDFVIVRGPPAATAGGEGPGSPPGGPSGPDLPGTPPSGATPAPPIDPLAEFFLGDEEAALVGAGPSRNEDQAEALREVLIFRLGLEEYALEIDTVREILKAPPITEVPRAPPHVLGVTMVRGQVIAVYDPRRRLGLAPAQAGPGARVVVCDAGGGPVGLLVDGVSEVLRLPSSALEARPQGIAGVDSEFIAGVGRGDRRFFALLDAAALLRRDPGATGGAE
jgi:purine-binding chemotaxis protein CheW